MFFFAVNSVSSFWAGNRQVAIAFALWFNPAAIFVIVFLLVPGIKRDHSLARILLFGLPSYWSLA